MADSKPPRVRLVAWERDPDVEHSTLVLDIIEKEVYPQDPKRTRRVLMRQLGALVDRWLEDPDVARISLELPHRVTGEPG